MDWMGFGYRPSLSIITLDVGSFSVLIRHTMASAPVVSADPHYAVVGQNNRNLLVQSKRLAPYHEDLTKVQPFEPSTVFPGERTRIKLDLKHALDRELVLNDIRLRFKLNFGQRANVGKVFAVRATDLIRELVVKINEDIVFKVDKYQELTHLWLLNNHRLGGENDEVQQSALLNHGVIPYGDAPPLYYKAADNTWYFAWDGNTTWSDPPTGPWADAGNRLRRPGLERHDGRPRLIYDDSVTPTYVFPFDVSLNQLVGSIFTRFHLRRVEYIQIELVFEPWVSPQTTQDFLLFKKDPTVGGTLPHPYSVARYSELEIRQYRTTLLDGVTGFTLPPSRMLSWLMHRFSRRDYTFNFDTQTQLDVQLHDWEIRTNIVRVWWMLAPRNAVTNPATENGFNPYAAPCEGYDRLYGVELLWKNDKVLDLETHHDVVRHYTLSDNKRYGLNNPHVRFDRLVSLKSNVSGEQVDGHIVDYRFGLDPSNPAANVNGFVPSITGYIGKLHYEVPIYFVDLAMNIHHGVHGAEVIGGIMNDTSDYVVRIKQIVNEDDASPVTGQFLHTGTRTIYVWIEYQTLVNLAAGSSQFNRGSQTITKQLNIQN